MASGEFDIASCPVRPLETNDLFDHKNLFPSLQRRIGRSHCFISAAWVKFSLSHTEISRAQPGHTSASTAKGEGQRARPKGPKNRSSRKWSPGVTADPIPRKSDPGRIRCFDPTLADPIRGINGAMEFLLSTSYSEL